MTEHDYIQLGYEIGKITKHYWFPMVLEYLNGHDENKGSMYFCELKWLYDKYGYKTVNDAINQLTKGGIY